MATRGEVPPAKNKRGAKSIKQKVRNSEAEVVKIEKHQAIFKEADIYKLVRIDRFLAVDRAREICKDIS